jgi:hypothetical protein
VGLLRSAIVRHKCGSQMSWCVDPNRKDGFRWRCRRNVSASACSASTSIRHGLCFQHSNLNFMEVMFLTYGIVRPVPARTIKQEHQFDSVSSWALSRTWTGVCHLPSIRIQAPLHFLLTHI